MTDAGPAGQEQIATPAAPAAADAPTRTQKHKAYLAARVAAGLCRHCAAPRHERGPGATPNLCGACAQVYREQAAARRLRKTDEDTTRENARRRDRYQQRASRGDCPRCGKARDGASIAAGWIDCSGCHGAILRNADSYRRQRRRRERPWDDIRRGEPLRTGGAVKGVHAVRTLRVTLDRGSRAVLDTLLRRDLEEQKERHCRRQGPAPDPEMRVSRILRAAILRRAERPCPPRADRPFWTKPRHEQPVPEVRLPLGSLRFLDSPLCIGFRVDAECLRILDRDARLHYRGNRSEAVRAALVAARPLVIATGPPRHRSANAHHDW